VSILTSYGLQPTYLAPNATISEVSRVNLIDGARAKTEAQRQAALPQGRARAILPSINVLAPAASSSEAKRHGFLTKMKSMATFKRN
jgi:hypothetical protein